MSRLRLHAARTLRATVGAGRGTLAMAVLGLAALLLILVTVQCGGPSRSTAALAPTPTVVRYLARGQVRPIESARVGTIGGGVVHQLLVEVGDPVRDQQEVARVRTSANTEIVVSPMHGTVTSLLVRQGDTVLPGAMLITVGDLSRLQVETTDLDEFLVADIRRGQRVELLIEALGREIPGQVRTISIEPVLTSTGDSHYPVKIDLIEQPPELRPGMSVRLRLAE